MYEEETSWNEKYVMMKKERNILTWNDEKIATFLHRFLSGGKKAWQGAEFKIYVFINAGKCAHFMPAKVCFPGEIHKKYELCRSKSF